MELYYPSLNRSKDITDGFILTLLKRGLHVVPFISMFNFASQGVLVLFYTSIKWYKLYGVLLEK